MKIKDGIQAVQTDILKKIRAILSKREDYESRLKNELASDFLDAKTLDGFIINCIVKYKIHYNELPDYYQDNVSFLVKICKRNIKFLDEIASSGYSDRVLLSVLKTLNLNDNDIKSLNGKTKKIIRSIMKNSVESSEVSI